MNGIVLKTTSPSVPMIYAYTTPEIARHKGWTKIGYTENDVEARIRQQTHTADIAFRQEWKGNAVYDDGSGETFTDHDFHSYLMKLGIERTKGTEWFHVNSHDSRTHFNDFRSNRGVIDDVVPVSNYVLRDEQERAVSVTLQYAQTHEGGKYLWNAKPRFGKTLSVYDLALRMGAQKVLIITNRPAIANSWYSDYEKFIGRERGYFFVSAVDGIQDKPLVMSHESYENDAKSRTKDHSAQPMGLIEFVSLQNLKGSVSFGGEYRKLEYIAKMTWDLLVIDEAHEGVDTYKTDVALDHIKSRFTLHLSGTPFKALANKEFAEDAIFNWTYADEQKAKSQWGEENENANPYGSLPRLNLFTYQMSEIIREELDKGLELNGETEEYAFDLNQFFEVKTDRFVHDASVDRFLDALTTQNKYPFSTDALRAELKHTFWIMNRVESAKAMARKLKAHPIFGEYEIILAAGDGKFSEEEETAKSYDRVVKAIAKKERTITLSVGQLTAGVTIPEWSAVLMLSNMRSPALYMQAAFRAQNPCLYRTKGKFGFARKENAYVFDFDPARTLMIYEQFANDLCESTSDGRGDSETRKEHIRELLNFFPVLGEDADGEMVELDSEKVLSIPRKIRSLEVVRRGFMSDYLFQNISNVFHAPQEVLNILKQLPSTEPGADVTKLTTDAAEKLSIDENGDVSLDEAGVIGRTPEVFGDKIFNDIDRHLEDAIRNVEADRENNALERLKSTFRDQALKALLEKSKETYGNVLKPSDQNRLESNLQKQSDSKFDRAYDDYSIKKRELENEREDQLENTDIEKHDEINRQYDAMKRQADEDLKKSLSDIADDLIQSASEEIVRTTETRKKEDEKKGIEDEIRSHLRGFSRTIPSFLMAYGDDQVTLQTFDTIIPETVFKEVTSISIAEFRFLRDGGDYTDPKTGETKHFEGHLFDPIVFDDSVREFMRTRVRLADYFDEANKEDIFDYIPPQKTNQIFTPKWVVKKMVDMLEQENPGCFDDPEKTFADLYMKSGLYIAEIVKRLYRSDTMRRLFPDDQKRLQHIFAKQVYGLAPTEIIYRIATNFILGFTGDIANYEHNFRQLDALEYAKAGTLETKLDEVFLSVVH